jgi:hypothetical protein
MTALPRDWRTRVHVDPRTPILTVAVLQQKGGSSKTTLASWGSFATPRGPARPHARSVAGHCVNETTVSRRKASNNWRG